MFSQTFTLTDGVRLAGSTPSLLSGVSPTWMRATLLCHTADAGTGMDVGDEVDVCGIYDSFSQQMPFNCGSNNVSNTVYANYSGVTGVAGACFFNWKNASVNPTSFSNFSLVLYWQ